MERGRGEGRRHQGGLAEGKHAFPQATTRGHAFSPGICAKSAQIPTYEAGAAAVGAPTDPDLQLAAGALFEFAERHGVGRGSGLVANGVWSDGTVSDPGFRLWPQTERLKAVPRRRPDYAPGALNAIERHLVGMRPGLWIERMDASGQAIAEPAPATSLYHLTAAFTDEAVLELGAQ